jgi:hypothetical protein
MNQLMLFREITIFSLRIARNEHTVGKAEFFNNTEYIKTLCFKGLHFMQVYYDSMTFMTVYF